MDSNTKLQVCLKHLWMTFRYTASTKIDTEIDTFIGYSNMLKIKCMLSLDNKIIKCVDYPIHVTSCKHIHLWATP